MIDTMYFGLPGALQEIRCPESGMGFVSTIDSEETPLVSGGRSVYRAPTAYKTFSMSWAANSTKLRHLIDCYNGQFGRGPFYLTDPSIGQDNVLPPRWSNAWQLAHQANGWCKPVTMEWPVSTVPSASQYQTNRILQLTQVVGTTNLVTQGVLKSRYIRIPGKAYRFAAVGGASGGAAIRIRGYDVSTNSWTLITTFTTFTGISAEIIPASNTTYSFIELDIYMPSGSQLVLRGMALGTTDFQTTDPNNYMPVGQGIGAVQFASQSAGNLVSARIDRIGLSLDFTEVEGVENAMV